MTMSYKRSMKIAVLAVFLTLIYAGCVFGAVSQEEAAQLGKSLTPWGAEVAGNKDGSIPPYTGGLTKAPATYVAGSGWRPDPFASEKPLFSITAQNMAQYADKLTVGTQATLKKYPAFHVDVYKTHRTAAYPQSVLDNTMKNALRTKVPENGMGAINAIGGFPYPIPKNGNEVIVNHNMRYDGISWLSQSTTTIAQADGSYYSTAEPMMIWNEHPNYYADQSRKETQDGFYWKIRWNFVGPVRKAGEGGQGLHNAVNDHITGPIHYLYLPGQRRVKLAPEVSFDTPNTDGAGTWTYDECWMFNSSMQRYDFKLLGKKEMYIPYNTYRLTYYNGSLNDMYSKGYINPNIIRWELHRVWVVGVTLKPGRRHIIPKRTFYVDEDTWAILASDVYDGHGNIYKASFQNMTQSYDMLSPYCYSYMQWNLLSGVSSHAYYHRKENGFMKATEEHPERWWSPDNLAGKGLR